MIYFYFPILILCFSIVNSCKNFIVHYCTDIPIKLSPILDIKCLQLLPVHVNISFDYTVENYIIKKGNKCYDIVSLDSSISTVLYSEQCQNICSENYCQLFDQHSNTSIINIFYSTTSNNESIIFLNNSTLSYDYYLFDSCSIFSNSRHTTLIIVYVLVGVVIILAIAVFIHCILRQRYKEIFDERIYEHFWLLDFFCCNLKRSNEPNNRINRKLSESVITDNNNSMVLMRPPWLSSPSAFFITNGTSNSSSNNRRNYNQSSTGNSSDQRQTNETLEHPSSSSTTIEPIDIEHNYPRDSNINNPNIENSNRRKSLPLLEKISSRASEALSARRSSIQYTTLASKSSIIVTRH